MPRTKKVKKERTAVDPEEYRRRHVRMWAAVAGTIAVVAMVWAIQLKVHFSYEPAETSGPSAAALEWAQAQAEWQAIMDRTSFGAALEVAEERAAASEEVNAVQDAAIAELAEQLKAETDPAPSNQNPEPEPVE